MYVFNHSLNKKKLTPFPFKYFIDHYGKSFSIILLIEYHIYTIDKY